MDKIMCQDFESLGRKFELMDGRVTFDFTSVSTVFQSDQDDGRIIMKGYVQWKHIYSRFNKYRTFEILSSIFDIEVVISRY